MSGSIGYRRRQSRDADQVVGRCDQVAREACPRHAAKARATEATDNLGPGNRRPQALLAVYQLLRIISLPHL
jgi:hypothetical protein